jgi:hypothetical protein
MESVKLCYSLIFNLYISLCSVQRTFDRRAGDLQYSGDSAQQLVLGVEGDLTRKGPSMAEPEKLGEAVKRYGYAKNNKIKLYGKALELVSDPVTRQDDDIFVDAREEGTNYVREVQVPRNVVQMAKAGKRNENQLVKLH